MKSDIREISRQVLGVRPFAGSIGKDKSDVVLSQKLKKIGREKSGMPHLDCVTKPARFLHFSPGSAFQFFVVLSPKAGRHGRITWQQFEKLVQPLAIPPEIRRQLPKDGAQLLAQREHA